MIWIGDDPKDHLVPLPWHEQGHLPLDQVAQIYTKKSFVTSIHPVLLTILAILIGKNICENDYENVTRLALSTWHYYTE